MSTDLSGVYARDITDTSGVQPGHSTLSRARGKPACVCFCQWRTRSLANRRKKTGTNPHFPQKGYLQLQSP